MQGNRHVFTSKDPELAKRGSKGKKNVKEMSSNRGFHEKGDSETNVHVSAVFLRLSLKRIVPMMRILPHRLLL